MGSRIHPMPGEPFCPNCHADDDNEEGCTEEHDAWCNRCPHGADDEVQCRECEALARMHAARFIYAFSTLILHGDEEHQAWLREAASQFVVHGTVPPPRPAPVRETHAKNCAYLRDLTAATAAMHAGTRLVIGPGAVPLAQCSCGAKDGR